MSPYTFSSHTLVPFDSLVNWSYEFDEIVSEWERGIFLRMQPFVALPIRLLNDIVDHQFATAKEKEARYNPHVARDPRSWVNLTMPVSWASATRLK